jgi:hypothetical protein
MREGFGDGLLIERERRKIGAQDYPPEDAMSRGLDYRAIISEELMQWQHQQQIAS